jgi:predicted N-acetyltransferase YhbS
MIAIRDEIFTDAFARERLLDAAMGPERFAKTCERLREGRLPARALSFVAEESSGEIVGTVRLWHVAAGDRPALMLGPLAVDCARRSAGLGGALMRHALGAAEALGHHAVLLVGDAPYYRRFGFSCDPVAGLDLPGPVDRARFLGLELSPGALAGASGMVRATGAVPLPVRDSVRVERRAA